MLNPLSIFGSILGNLSTHMIKFATDSWGIAMAMIHGDYYEIGKDLGEMIMLLLQ